MNHCERFFRFASQPFTHQPTRSFKALHLLLIGLLMGGIVAVSSLQAAVVTTDSSAYQPGSKVGISGMNYVAGERVRLVITYADGTPLPSGVVSTWEVTASLSGSIGGTDVGLNDGSGDTNLDGFLTNWWMLQNANPGASLRLTATGETSGYAASTTLLVANTKFHQLQNGTPANPEWAGGAINANNSCYAESQSVPYRFFMLSMSAGTTHTFKLTFEATKSTLHSFDYLSQYNLTESGPIVTVGGECSSTSAAAPDDCSTPAAVAALRDPRLVTSYVSAPPADISDIIDPLFPIDGPGNLFAYNAINVQVGQYSFGGTATNRELNVIVSFQVVANGSVGFFWAGHLATGDPTGWGLGQGSGSISGAPFHMSAGEVDGSGGMPNLAVQNGVVCLPPDLTMTCGTGPYCSGGTFTCSVPAGATNYTWTVTGGTIGSGQGTNSITYTITAAVGQPVTVHVDACNVVGGCYNQNCCNDASTQLTAVDCCQVAITCPPTATVECNQSTNPSNTGTPTYTTTGVCPLPITFSYTDTETAGTCPQEKTISRLWKAKDANGVVRAQCTQTINVADNTAPVLSNCPGPVTVQCSSIPAPANPIATDNCDLTPTITYNQTTTPGSCPQQYTLTRTWTATDDCGNSSLCSQVITVQDTQAPVVTCPAPISVQCIANVPTPNTALVTAVDNCDPSPTITFVSDVSNGQTCPEKITRTYRATDHCGNSATCTQLITIQDTNPPVVTCPGPISVQCFADVPNPNTALVSAVDNCDASPTIVWLSDQVGTGNCPKTIIRTYKAIDDCGNIGTCTQTITVNDNTPPVITCPPNESIYCGESSDPSNTGYATATDNCTASGSIVITYIDTPNGGGFTRTWKATDECGNQSTCQQTISTPPDLTPPQITCPDDITVECFADVPAPSPVSVVVIDNCDPNPVVVFVDDERNGTSCPYTITREYKATDASGNWVMCTQIITVDDTTPPVITCPPNTTIYCNESSDPSNTGYATATDNCTATGNIVITYSDSQNGGGITRTWKATDDCDNWSSCQQIISTSPDTTPPQITCPDPVTVECPADVPTPIPLLIVAVDDCDPSPVVIWVSDVSQGSCPTIITRTYKATDASGNWATCTQIITVDDQTLPQLVGCPSNVTVSCDNIPAPANVTATDNCPGVTVNYSQNETPGQCAQEKTITRTWTATDLCGNQVSCSQVITVEDNTPPVFTNCPGGMTVECIGDVPQPNPALCTATDNCDPNPTITFVSDVSNGQTCPEIITRTYKATDACGNEATCQQIITVDDTTPPQITCPAGITVSCLAEKPQPNPALCTVTDNCDPAPSVVFVSDVQNGTGCPFTITRKYSAMDHCGNIASCEQIITVHDQTPPVLVDCPQNVTVNCGNVPPVANVTATDNCNGNVSVVFGETTTPGNCAYNYTITRTWTATDACGNVASCQQTITVQDVTPPQIACPNGVTVECIANKPQPNPALVTATDNCDPNPVVVWVSDVVGQQRCPAQIIRTYRATDACGNQATCTQMITVEDRTAPSFTTFPADQNIFQCQPTQICLPVAATDNCQGPVVLSLMNGSKGAINAGQWCVTPTVTESYNVTIRATDTCGNFVDRTFHVDYRLNSAPTFTNCPQDARIHWGETYTVDLNATDPDAGQTLTYSLCPGAPQGVTIDPTTGVLRFASTARDICDPEICVIVKDDCQATATCSFNVCVYNEPPTFDTTSSICPGDQVICYGYSFADSVHATDPDNGPYGPFYYKLSGPPELTVNVNTGKIEWLSPLPGNYVICVLATDSGKTCVPCSPSNADTCCFELRVISLDLVIEKKHDQVQGQFTDVSISFMRQGSNWPIAGYDLLIQYDNSALTFQKADEGKFFKDCVWEYFTYRFGQNGNCGPGACPTGVLRIVAMAETTGGNMAEHPDCYTNDGIPNPGPDSSTSKEMAVLRFLVSNDRTLECQFAPIRFVWYDCGDNSLSNVRGDTLFISNFVYDYAGEVGHPPVVQWHDITGLDNTWPTVTGALRAECDSIHFKSELIQCANFYNGGVDIVCADSIDAPGDINMNDIAYEIADAVMFTNYFISGLSAFVDCTGLTEAALDACREHQQGAIAASDANRDGIMLSVSDLVYVIRVVVGDAQPYGKGTPMAAVPVDYSIEDGVVTVSGGIDLGGAALMVRGEVKPQLLAPDMSMTYAFDGEMTRIVVTPPVEATSMHTFRGAFLGGITGEVVSLELATAAGAPVAAKNVPSRYELSQNYPNPFNPSTKINVALKDAGDYSLTIYNVQGQVVEVIRGSAAGPERLEISWNASGLASGVYLYRLDAGQFTQTRKMLLLK